MNLSCKGKESQCCLGFCLTSCWRMSLRPGFPPRSMATTEGSEGLHLATMYIKTLDVLKSMPISLLLNTLYRSLLLLIMYIYDTCVYQEGALNEITPNNYYNYSTYQHKSLYDKFYINLSNPRLLAFFMGSTFILHLVFNLGVLPPRICRSALFCPGPFDPCPGFDSPQPFGHILMDGALLTLDLGRFLRWLCFDDVRDLNNPF